MKSFQTRQQKMELTLQISFRTLPFPCDPVSPTKFTTCFAGATGSAPTAPPPNSSTADWLPLANGNKLRRRRRRALTPLNRQMKGKTACEQAVSISHPFTRCRDSGHGIASTSRPLGQLTLHARPAQHRHLGKSEILAQAAKFRKSSARFPADHSGKTCRHTLQPLASRE